jgi:hypothetical protein
MLASERGQLEIVTMLLAKLDTRVDMFHLDSTNDGLAPAPERDSPSPDSSGDTPGSSGSGSGLLGSVRLNALPVPRVAELRVNSALHLAYTNGHQDIVRLLLGSPHVDVNAVDVGITCTYVVLATRLSAGKTLWLTQVIQREHMQQQP